MSEYIKNLSETLRREYPHKTELHAHTNPASGCSEVKPHRLAELYHELGYSAVCVTNHLDLGMGHTVESWTSDYIAAKEAGDKLGINILLGVEVCLPNDGNHYLLYGITLEDVPELFDNLGMSVAEFSRAYRGPGRFFNHAHPYRPGLTHADYSLFDGMEAFNVHPGHNSRVAIASRDAHSEGLIFTAGTDYHEYSHEGLSAARSRTVPKTSADIANILKSGDFLVEVGGSIILP